LEHTTDRHRNRSPSKMPDSWSPARWPGNKFLVGPNPHDSRTQVCEWILSTTQPLYEHPRWQGLSWCRGRSPFRRTLKGATPPRARPCVPSRLLVRWRGAPWTQFLCLPLAGSLLLLSSAHLIVNFTLCRSSPKNKWFIF